MKKIFFCIVAIQFFLSCRREETKYTVVYKVTTAESHPSYTLHYTLPDGSTKSQGIITSQYWNSGSLDDFRQGSHLSFSIEANGGSYQMSVYVNGHLEQTRPAGPSGVQSLQLDIQ